MLREIYRRVKCPHCGDCFTMALDIKEYEVFGSNRFVHFDGICKKFVIWSARDRKLYKA